MWMSRGARRFALALLAATAVTFFALYLGNNPRFLRGSPSSPLPNVVLVVVDTLRADHLSLYGYGRPTSHRLDRLAAQRGVVLENVRSQAPCTFPSVNSLLTSRSPVRFVGRPAGVFSIPDEYPTVASVLRGAGYSTGAVSASPIVRATPSAENPAGGFGAGFDQFDESCEWEFAPCVNDRALDLLDRMRAPFFLYLHYMDPHDPYILPGARNPRFSGPLPPGPDREALAKGEVNSFAARLYGPEEDAGLDDSELQFLLGRYDESIHYWDSWFANLIDGLAGRGLLENTIIVLASDHGEEFLEHGDLKHCRNVFDTSVRVPLVFFVPGASPRRLPLSASNLDIFPTILDLARIPASDFTLEGSSVAPWLTGRTQEPPALHQFSWWGPSQSVSDGTHKLIFSAESRQFALYRLDHDPHERFDISDENRRITARLAQVLRQQLVLDPYLEERDGNVLEQQLKSLGYLQ